MMTGTQRGGRGTRAAYDLAENLVRDLRYAGQQLLRTPGFSAVLIGTVALGIGATTVIFSLANALIFRPLPVADPATLITFEEVRDGQLLNSVYSYAAIQEYDDRASAAMRIAAYGMGDVTVAGEGFPEALLGSFVTANFFDLVGVRPVVGRFFASGEEFAGSTEAVAVISHRLWRERYGGAVEAIGRTVRMNGHPVTIVGVAPPGFHGLERGLSVEAWFPIPLYAQFNPGANIAAPGAFFWLVPIARLNPGVTLAQAESVLSGIGSSLESRPAQHRGVSGVRVWPLTGIPSQFRTPVRLFLGLLFATAALVLLIACVNVGGMLLARGASRRREIGTRLALGASRGRVVAQLLTESGLLFVLGGAGGLLVAHAITSSLSVLQSRLLSSVGVPMTLSFPTDRAVLVFALVSSLVSGVVFGLIPAFRTSLVDVASSLKSAGPGTVAARSRLRSVFVVGQVAMSVLLLVTAGLLARSLQRALAMDSGLRPDGIVVANLNLTPHGYDLTRGEAFIEQFRERLQGRPEVHRVSFAHRTTLDGQTSRQSFTIPGVEPPEGAAGHLIDHNAVDHAYFATVGIPMVAGRAFAEEDRRGSAGVAIVNETMARRYWPMGEALGSRVLAGTTELEIVGIARDAKYRSLEEEPIPFLYRSLAQSYSATMTVHVASAGPHAGALVPLVRSELLALDPNVPLLGAGPLAVRITGTFLPQRLGAMVIGAFGGLGLLLTAIGLYGLLAYTVAQRTRETGIRIAMGARPRDVLAMVVHRGLILVAIGLAAGLGLALATTRLLSRLLVQVSPTDSLTFAGVILTLAAVALLASYLPARRALRVDPVVALRSD